MKNYDKRKKQRKLSFKIIKQITKIKYKKPAFIFLGEEIKDGSIILCNHEGTDAPMSLEIYCKNYLRMWGTHEMNSGLKMMYKYQTLEYYHKRKGWNLTLARLFCLIASPLTNLFYSGLNLISTYKDIRFTKTLKESYNAIKNKENIVIFPEDSTNGYLEELESFFKGFAKLAEYTHKKGLNVPIYVAYYQNKNKVFVIDKPVYFKDYIYDDKTLDEMAIILKNRCNELGKMSFSREELKLSKEKYYI